MDVESEEAELLRKADVVIIDEISSLHTEIFNFVDNLLREIELDPLNKLLPFAGKVYLTNKIINFTILLIQILIIGGDFKQTMPVAQLKGQHLAIYDQYASDHAQYQASIKTHPLFTGIGTNYKFEKHRLTINKRLEGEETIARDRYRAFLKHIGTGINTNDYTFRERVKLHKDWVVEKMDDVKRFVFGEFLKKADYRELRGRAILCPTNKEANRLHTELLAEMPGVGRVYGAIHVTFNERSMAEDIVAVNAADVYYAKPPSNMPDFDLVVKEGMHIFNVTIIKYLY